MALRGLPPAVPSAAEPSTVHSWFGERTFHPGANPSGTRPALHRGVLLLGVSEPTSWSCPSGPPLPGEFWFLLAEQPIEACFHGGLLRETSRPPSGVHWRVDDAAFSFGSAPCGPLGNHSTPSHSTGFGSDSSVPYRLVATPGGAESIYRFRFCSTVDNEGTGRVSADARRATVRP